MTLSYEIITRMCIVFASASKPHTSDTQGRDEYERVIVRTSHFCLESHGFVSIFLGQRVDTLGFTEARITPQEGLDEA